MAIRHRFLFNFAASHSSGGYKRLYAFAKWFGANGGAWFIVHARCASLIREFPANRFFLVAPSLLERLVNDCGYLNSIAREIGEPDMYYTNGIPLYSRFGQINWFNLSNVAPLGTKAIPLSPLQRLKNDYLGIKIRTGLIHADVISGESASSLAMLKCEQSDKLFLSVNGSDDELADLRQPRVHKADDIATVVGTVAYKNLEQSYRVFEMLRDRSEGLKLVVIGNPGWVPRVLRNKEGVTLRGYLRRDEVIECLRQTRYYISTTCLEGSFNAAAEGIFLADESYISDIGPHRELLIGEPFEEVTVPGLSAPLLRVRREKLSGTSLRTWNSVIVELVAKVHEKMRG